MKLRNYISEDANTIASWIADEKSLYQWSADRINKFPICGNDINRFYTPIIGTDRFIPLTYVCDDEIVGHLTIRYPINGNDKVVRFGFVIVNPTLRGQGYGKKMLIAAIEYVKNILKADKITLGVFANNDNAKYCYKSVGFENIGKNEIYCLKIGEWECEEMQLNL